MTSCQDKNLEALFCKKRSSGIFKKLIFLSLLSLLSVPMILLGLFIEVNKISAGQITVGAMPIGTVVSFGGIRWIKIDSENTFMAVDGLPAYTPPSTKFYMVTGETNYLAVPVTSVDNTCSWSPTTYLKSPTDCGTNITPTANGTTTYTVTVSDGNTYTYTIEAINYVKPRTLQGMTKTYCNSMSNLDTLTLTDSRDNKTYRVRKFADGHCWMIDNLAYGGTTEANGTVDACATKVTFSGNGQTTPYTAWYSGSQQLYGDCRNAGSYPGYLYNWQAAMQQSLAYYNVNYTGPASNNGAGICPTGWLLPTGGSTGQFYALHTTYSSLSGTSANFWANATYWNGVYSGFYNNAGTLYDQASYAYYWSSTQYGASSGYSLGFNTGGTVYPQNNDSKNYGFSVRCVYSP